MTSQEKVEHWLDIAEYDLETAAAMQQSGRYLYTVFMCQQAFEKLLKAIYLQRTKSRLILTICHIWLT